MRGLIALSSGLILIFLANNVRAETACGFYSAESECQAAGFCTWDPGKQMCQGGFQAASFDSCRQITCPCKCKPALGCQWNQAQRRCETI